MAGSIPPDHREYEINLEMWRHYDNVRQEKSKTFLTAQTILAAVSAFVVESQGLHYPLILAVSVLGFVSSMLWFLLLFRNAEYIRFHRERVMELEPGWVKVRPGKVKELEPGTGMHFTTFSDKWPEFNKQLWPRRSSKKTDEKGLLVQLFGSLKEGLLVQLFGSSNMIDRLLALLFMGFWLALLVSSLVSILSTLVSTGS